MPLNIDVDSSFITITIYVTTTTIPAELRPYLEIYMESFFSLPLNVETEDGERKQLTYEEVVSELNKDTVSYTYSLGVNGSFEEMVCLQIKVEASKYENGIRWLRNLLWNTEFTAERLKICATKLFNDIPQSKRDGYSMSATVLQLIHYDPAKSNKYALSVLNQEKVLPNTIQLLDDDPDRVIEEFYRLRKILTSPENFRVHVIGDILKLNQPKTSWIDNFKIIPDIKHLSPVPSARDVLTEYGRHPGNKGYVIELSAIENQIKLYANISNAYTLNEKFFIKIGPTTYDSPDLAPLLVLCELLHTMEGIFWRLIRGQGLAYSVGLKVGVESGHIYLTIYRSPDSYKAYDQARQAVHDLAERKIEFDKSGLDGAKCGVIYGLVKSESNNQRAASESFALQVLKNVDPTYNRILISKVQDVNIDDLYEMLSKYIINLFLPGSSSVVVVSAPGKVEDVREGFNSHGFKLDVKNLNDVLE
ncbi:14352_t:CDS:10 [Acaulospora colombiana]|uniref:14352_t:CDS:1 n=1 Tax=Acaulospora colombiana TaxID=27376 RepID=A0ACA9LPE2_9GLOM|nr:14352_t:CDS:10 [Acaulospora colombiana]